MPEESIVDNKIFFPSDYCTPYSIYVFDEEAWTRIDFEVRT
ncbi:unnamed protein product [marine sediment metagenome]|uniref:Uncharacterized protein n=1 Tax=marine sediment metagenome TaxID=412755 RepID=X1IP98_9ZZZZ